MAFWPFQKAAPPPPPFAGIDAMRRDVVSYMGMLALSVVPAIDFSDVGGQNLSPEVRLGYFAALATGAVFVGSKRQDVEGDEVSSVGLENAALAPVFASLSLGGLYALIKFTGLNPGAVRYFRGSNPRLR